MNFFNLSVFAGVVCLFKIYQVNCVQCGSVHMDHVNTGILRIAFGEETLPGQWPFLVAIYLVNTNSSRFICGGTLISNKHVLTAAHCLQTSMKLELQQIEVLVGTHNLTERHESNIIKIAEIHIHPNWTWDGEKMDNDIAILVLKKNVSFSNYIRPVCLPADDANIVGLKGSIAGWGLTENSSEENQQIQRKGTTTVLELGYCLTTYTNLAKLASIRMFCGTGGHGTPYHGDSGGGVFVRNFSTWVQIGIVSVLDFGNGTELDVNTPAVYTSVKEFNYWITQTIGDSAVSLPDAHKMEIMFTCYYKQLLRTWFVLNFDVKIENVYVATFTNVFGFGTTPEDLKAVAFQNGTLYALPNGIGKTFNNLHELHVGKSLGTKVIRRSNFEDMENLITLLIGENDIVRLDKDTLWDLPNLKEFSLNRNHMRNIHEKTFDMNTKLSYVDLDENQIEFLPRNLFQNNALLKSIHFRGNRLQIIEIDFTKLKAVKNGDFYANKCMSFYFFLNNMSIEEFQTMIRNNCSGTEANF